MVPEILRPRLDTLHRLTWGAVKRSRDRTVSSSINAVIPSQAIILGFNLFNKFFNEFKTAKTQKKSSRKQARFERDFELVSLYLRTKKQ